MPVFSSCFFRLVGLGIVSAFTLLTPGRIRPVVAQADTAQIVANGSLTVAIAGLSNQNGQVCISLFDSARGFPDDPDVVVTQQCVPADGSDEAAEGAAEAVNDDATTDDNSAAMPEETDADVETVMDAESDTTETTVMPEDAEETEADVVVTFSNLVSGTYAVSVLHDENGDQQINQGSFGIPTEGFGFSRNPAIRTGAPDFADAAVFVLGETTTQIELIYF